MRLHINKILQSLMESNVTRPRTKTSEATRRKDTGKTTENPKMLSRRRTKSEKMRESPRKWPSQPRTAN